MKPRLRRRGFMAEFWSPCDRFGERRTHGVASCLEARTQSVDRVLEGLVGTDGRVGRPLPAITDDRRRDQRVKGAGAALEGGRLEEPLERLLERAEIPGRVHLVGEKQFDERPA